MFKKEIFSCVNDLSIFLQHFTKSMGVTDVQDKTLEHLC